MKNNININEVIEELWPKIYRLCYRFVGERDAEDLTQETFLKFIKNKDKFRGDSKLSTYIYRIAVNICIDKKRKPVMESYDDKNEFLKFHLKNKKNDILLEKRINSAINLLPKQRKAVFILRMLEKYSTRETAEMLSISEGTIKTHLFKAMIDLRVTLGKVLEEVK